jgi:branched-chain amino acid transport system substrate-binding protein
MKYGYEPGDLAAQGYDTAFLIDSAVRAVGGMVSDKEGMIKALHSAKFDSVRGAFSFNNNNFPIQDLYIAEVAKDDQGVVRPVLKETILRNDKDVFGGDCPLQW